MPRIPNLAKLDWIVLRRQSFGVLGLELNHKRSFATGLLLFRPGLDSASSSSQNITFLQLCC